MAPWRHSTRIKIGYVNTLPALVDKLNESVCGCAFSFVFNWLYNPGFILNWVQSVLRCWAAISVLCFLFFFPLLRLMQNSSLWSERSTAHHSYQRARQTLGSKFNTLDRNKSLWTEKLGKWWPFNTPLPPSSFEIQQWAGVRLGKVLKLRCCNNSHCGGFARWDLPSRGTVSRSLDKPRREGSKVNITIAYRHMNWVNENTEEADYDGKEKQSAIITHNNSFICFLFHIKHSVSLWSDHPATRPAPRVSSQSATQTVGK